MLPREWRQTSKQDLFRSRLDQVIHPKHAPVKLARTNGRTGRPANHPIVLEAASSIVRG